MFYICTSLFQFHLVNIVCCILDVNRCTHWNQQPIYPPSMMSPNTVIWSWPQINTLYFFQMNQTVWICTIYIHSQASANLFINWRKKMVHKYIPQSQSVLRLVNFSRINSNSILHCNNNHMKTNMIINATSGIPCKLAYP